MLSVIIPARNERFLQNTIDDVLDKAQGDVEVIAVLEGYWPDPPLKEDKRLIVLHNGVAKGLRGAVNSAVAVAKGEYIMKCDAHCMFGEGYDVILAADCEYDWVAVPRRYSLDAENWCRKNKHPIDYLWVECPMTQDKNKNRDLNVRVWGEKDRDPELQKLLIDDVFTFQGSCWFMHKDYFHQLELMDEENYGTFRKEPQEITFKAWLSGGRVVRNKKTWYAHLHKGRQYGRGYRPSRSDWAKGDRYLNRWMIDAAWDKQTKPFRWMIEKFDMPGWENFDWDNAGQFVDEDIEPKEVKEEPKKRRRVVRIYQNIPLEGVVWQNENRLESKFWNEGKWDNFIEPFLPDDCKDQALVDMGCNAGLFLKIAEDRGFRNIVGIEKDKTPVNEGLRYRDSIGYNYKILKRVLGGQFGESGTFDFDELPIADYTILSTFHYYIDINAWTKYLDRIRSKSRNIIIISRPKMKRLHWKAYSSLNDLICYFSDWDIVGVVDDVSPDGDPSPRNLFSVMFNNPLLKRVPIENVVLRESTDDTMYVAMADLAKNVVENPGIDPFETDYYKRWCERKKGRWSNRTIRKFVKGKYDLMVDIIENGPKDPVIVDNRGRLCDGGHRLVLLKALGYKSVIVREVC